jgi:hypothetical protein
MFQYIHSQKICRCANTFLSRARSRWIGIEVDIRSHINRFNHSIPRQDDVKQACFCHSVLNPVGFGDQYSARALLKTLDYDIFAMPYRSNFYQSFQASFRFCGIVITEP